MSVIDKIVEEYLKQHLNDYFEDNNLLLDDHHGSRRYHSTLSALSVINHHNKNNYHNDLITANIQTDLSAAYDTVDHDTLLDKLCYYGVTGKENNIIRSFLANRYQFVSIDGIRSDIIPSIPCSVIQGSKL